MKHLFLAVYLLLSLFLIAQDPRTYNHGSCIVGYKTNTDSIHYYLTWSSAFNNGWEHDIYNETVYFNTNGTLLTKTPTQRYIGTGSDEAQEPVNAAINTTNNYMLSVWEDGSDLDAPNVRGQLHTPAGTIIKSNWIIAGGVGAQHSAVTAHLGNKFVVFYADESPPASAGAVLKGKVIDDLTGVETQEIIFSPNNEDHWWPVTISNTSASRTLIIWGNDGYAARGTVLYETAETIQQSNSPIDYLTNIQQYYYQVEWLAHCSKFILIARIGAYENKTDESQVCLIDTMGNMTNTITVAGGILREAKMAVNWNECDQSYSVVYPSGINSLSHIKIDSTGVISPLSTPISNHPDLINTKWVETGIWSTFAKDVQGNNLVGNQPILFAIMGDTLSNNIIKLPIRLDYSLFCNTTYVDPVVTDKPVKLYPNPVASLLNIETPNNITSYTIFNSLGKQMQTQNKGNCTEINVSEFPAGIYSLELHLSGNHTVVQQFIKN